MSPIPARSVLVALLIAVPFWLGCDEANPIGSPQAAGKGGPSWEVYFSPSGGCTEAVVKALAQAKASILVQAYSFTSAPIAKALVEAARRGVKVDVLLDKSQRTEKYSSADFVAHEVIPTRIDAAHAIAHNKVMVIDGTTVVTGSFSFTKAAEEHNAENLLVIQDPTLAEKYAANWKVHADHSETYAGKQSEARCLLTRVDPPGHMVAWPRNPQERSRSL